ncbi:hypothetical protein CRENBAI_025063 [Crenichthys baileyi]|uniref:Uncharacterized protein n=1 Tax=Crenichthys baileyi TaxID=28760 RepID=A0AAV9QS55_9TELE
MLLERCDWQVLRCSCCSSASNQPGLKRSGDREGVFSSLSHKAWECFLPEFLWASCLCRVQMNVEIQASKNLSCKSPFCLPPGPMSLKISFYQASENPPPACPPSHGLSFSSRCPLNGVKHKVRRTRKYFSPLLHPPVNLNHHVRSQSCPLIQSGFQNELTFVNKLFKCCHWFPFDCVYQSLKTIHYDRTNLPF